MLERAFEPRERPAVVFPELGEQTKRQRARARIRDAAVFFFRLEGLDQRRERAQRDGRAQRVRRARGDRAQTREERLGFGARRPGVQGVRRVRL